MVDRLLGRADIHSLANRLGIRPTKVLGQNFIHDANTIRRIVRTAELDSTDVVLEIGPGLGSLTLGLLPMCRQVIAVEIDPVLADALPATVETKAPSYVDNLAVIQADALQLTENSLKSAGVHTKPTVLVANLPYNVAVPIVLHVFSIFTSLTKALVMVQSEVAERMAAPPGSKIYGVPSVKVAWYAAARRAGMVPRSVFWPVPNVDSELVLLTHRAPPAQAQRQAVFDVVDAAFAQRRKMLRSALAGWAGSPQRAQEILHAAGIDPTLRGEALDVNAYAQIANAAKRLTSL